MENNKDIRTAINEEKGELVYIVPKKEDNFNSCLLTLVMRVAYQQKATLTYYELNNELVCILKSKENLTKIVEELVF